MTQRAQRLHAVLSGGCQYCIIANKSNVAILPIWQFRCAFSRFNCLHKLLISRANYSFISSSIWTLLFLPNRYYGQPYQIRRPLYIDINIHTTYFLTVHIYYMLFSYQTGYIMWHSRLRIYIPWGAAEGNIYHKPGMSHYIPCLIAE